MAKRAKAKNRLNNWRQKQYLRIGVVMLPDTKTERKVVTDALANEKRKEEKL